MNFLLVFGFSLLAFGSCFPQSEQIPQRDRELIRELARNLKKLEESVYPGTNATVIAVYKSILQHNIADEPILKEARDYLKEWENATDKYPPISNFERIYVDLYSNPEEKTKWDHWTSGSFSEILDKFRETSNLVVIQMVESTTSKLSESTKTYIMSRFEADFAGFTPLIIGNQNPSHVALLFYIREF